MKKMVALIALFIAIALVFVVLPGQITSQDVDPGTYVEGFVYDASTQEPLSEAYVIVFGDTFAHRVVTNEEGYYSIELDVRVQEQYDILAEKEGYYDQWDSFEVRRGETMVMDFHLEPMEAHIMGYVISSEDGEPLQRVNVQLMATDVNGYDSYTGTDENGFWEVYSRPGSYKLVVSGRNHEQYQSDEFELKEGDDLWHNVTLKLMDTGIHGHVTDPGGDPLGGAWVSLYTEDYRRVFGAPTDESGFYEIRCPGGDYIVEISADGYMPYEDTVTVTEGEMLEYDAQLDEISFSGILQYILDIIREIFGSIF
jgi:hypothetical protein